MRFTTLLVLFVAASATAIAQEPGRKAAIPDEAAQKAAATLITNVYKSDYEKAKTSAQKIELSRKLLGEGTATKGDSVSRFGLFTIARDLAAKQGDLNTAFNAIDRISLEFEIDKLQMQVDAATTAVKALKIPKDKQACVALLSPLIDEALASDRYDQAKSLAALTLLCEREGRDPDRIKQIVAKSKEIDEIAADFEKVKQAKIILQATPTDSAANFAVAKFLCFFKNDWQRGVSMLALGNDQEFKAVALFELEQQPDALKVGDGWWKISESLEGTAKSRTQAHAGEWYQKGLPGLSGLNKVKVGRLLDQLKKDAEDLARLTSSGGTSQPSTKGGTYVVKLLEDNSFSGWTTTTPAGTPNWAVKNGVLTNFAKGPNVLTKGKYTDFDLHLEYSLPAEGNSGVYLRGRYELQLLDNNTRDSNGKPVPPYAKNGAIWGLLAPSSLVYSGTNRWNSLDVRLVDRTVTVKLSDITVIDAQQLLKVTSGALDGRESEPGPIMLQSLPAFGAKFRNITITPLK